MFFEARESNFNFNSKLSPFKATVHMKNLNFTTKYDITYERHLLDDPDI